MYHKNKGWILFETILFFPLILSIIFLITLQWRNHLFLLKGNLYQLETQLEKEAIQTQLHQDIFQSEQLELIHNNTIEIKYSPTKNIRYSYQNHRIKRQINKTIQYLSFQTKPKKFELKKKQKNMLQITLSFPHKTYIWWELLPHEKNT